MTAEVPKSIRKRSDLVADQIKETIISKKFPPVKDSLMKKIF